MEEKKIGKKKTLKLDGKDAFPDFTKDLEKAKKMREKKEKGKK